MGVLDDILARKRDEVTVLHQPSTRETIQRGALESGPTRGFEERLRARSRGDGTLAVIAEIKRRSPSKGDLAPELDAATTAAQYELGGAACLSVLTDGPYFGGSVADLRDARAATSATAVLRKDFTIDPDQVYETRGIGADAILLIVAALPDDAVLRDLHALAGELGLDVLVEAHDEAELDRAVALGASCIGVNARDLDTFSEDLGVVERLVARLPADTIAVAESAIRSVEDAQRVAAAGFDAVLVGEALVRAKDPEALVRDLSAVPTSSRS
ncbi:MAG: indole-3-glycerol-phosphate synthase [Actinobacteria bacterium]|nr:indole-3-glycerol-phosphate synthase [Actinomycetota bacterium]